MIEETAMNLGLNMAHLSAGLAIGLGALGAGLGIGFAIRGLMDAVSRQPEVANKAFIYFLVGAALSEACALYAFVVAYLLIKA